MLQSRGWLANNHIRVAACSLWYMACFLADRRPSYLSKAALVEGWIECGVPGNQPAGRRIIGKKNVVVARLDILLVNAGGLYRAI